MKTIVVIAGLLIIALSFIYILKNPKQSMMDALMNKRKQAQKEQEEEKPFDQTE